MTYLHLSLLATDLDASVRFYSALFGTAPDKRHDDYARFTVADPPLVLALRPAIGELPAGRVDHMGLRLADRAAVQAAEARLNAAGLALRPEQGVACCYSVQDKVWLSDPDGNAWEVYTVLGESLKLAPDGGGCCVPTAAAAPEPAAQTVPPACCG